MGNAPITVTFGKSLKFKFADYIGDNDKTARGDGYIVNVDGSTLPVIGAFKPMITGVYGSKGGANSDYQYYRGIRAEITPVGTLKAGLNYMQEGLDQTGYKVTAGLAAAPLLLAVTALRRLPTSPPTALICTVRSPAGSSTASMLRAAATPAPLLLVRVA